MELVGLLLPILIDVINRKIADSDARFWISVLVCAVIGIILNFLTTSFHFVDGMAAFNSITASIGAVFVLAQVSYKALWEKSGIRSGLTLKGGTQ